LNERKLRYSGGWPDSTFSEVPFMLQAVVHKFYFVLKLLNVNQTRLFTCNSEINSCKFILWVEEMHFVSLWKKF